MLTIALSKGKLLGQTLPLFAEAGYPTKDLTENSRRLVFAYPDRGITYLIVRPSDVPAYVEHGAADIGVVGKDVLLEHMDHRVLGEHHRDGGLLIEPTPSHFDLLQPERVGAHLEAVVRELRESPR